MFSFFVGREFGYLAFSLPSSTHQRRELQPQSNWHHAARDACGEGVHPRVTVKLHYYHAAGNGGKEP
jgi:hypothetical protein